MKRLRAPKMTATFNPEDYVGSDLILAGAFKGGTQIRFRDKSVIVPELSSDDDYDLTNFLNDGRDNTVFDLKEDIQITIDRDQIKYQIGKFMGKYRVDPSQFVVSYKSALVYHGLYDGCRDIDLIVTPELSYRLEDEFGITRTLAPMGNTSKQVIGDIELYAVVEEPLSNILTSEDATGVKYEKPETVIKKYRLMNREKDINTIKTIEQYLSNKQSV